MIEKIQNVREELLLSIQGLTDQEFNVKVEVEDWSIAQIFMHLFLLERVMTRSIKDQLEGGSLVTVEEKPVHLTVIRKKKLKAPSFLEPKDRFYSFEEVVNKLSKSRQALIEVVRNADESSLKQKAIPHPAFGQLNLKQVVEFIGYHEQRHISQIEEIKQKINQLK